jgi:hypothetical protein
MSNDTKSRIMLWLFIFLLCMFSFFAGRVTRADTVHGAEDTHGPGREDRCTPRNNKLRDPRNLLT